MVTSVQRFGGALNLHVHFHTLVLDGVFVRSADGTPLLRRDSVARPTGSGTPVPSPTAGPGVEMRIGREPVRRCMPRASRGHRG